jgi:hypothetical protein
LINPDGDIDISWVQRGSSSIAGRQLLTQCDSSTASAREFFLRWNSGLIDMIVGGVVVIATSDSIQISDGNWRILYSGTTVQVFLNGSLVKTITGRTRGAAREPSAPTRIGVRNNGGSLLEFYQGIIYNIRINGVLWQMSERNSATQVSTPAGNTMTLVNTTSDRWQEIIE